MNSASCLKPKAAPDAEYKYMKCNPKTMLKIGVVLAVVLGGSYFTFPQLRPVVIGLAPFALFALCPISIFFAMRGMNKDKENHDGCASCTHKNAPAKNT